MIKTSELIFRIIGSSFTFLCATILLILGVVWDAKGDDEVAIILAIAGLAIRGAFALVPVFVHYDIKKDIKKYSNYTP